ncbi:hypothetical protein [Paraburkholderia solisilvae]|uniref:Transmembrane protein n=1 Tax=Paraburkholderia solisilvae TaxID=624376 RepID=A0A6J5DEC1_9BURK|nr:hypothetical protein [Paraburkholderia solisilvae]CAB3752660.1 hypothetical protein LMG29739_01553 [Paraburkholderia solisilvae]
MSERVSYLILPIFSMRTIRCIFVVCCLGLSLAVIVAPGANDEKTEFLGTLCNAGNYIPIVRALNREPGACYLPIGYGGAIVLGFLVAVCMCICEFPRPMRLESMIPADRKKYVMATVVMLVVLVSTWTIAVAPPTLGIMGLMSLNRVAVFISAPMMFVAHVGVWWWLFLVSSIEIRKRIRRMGDNI